MLLTFGLLSPNKGIEHVLRAVPAIPGSIRNCLHRPGGDPPEPGAHQGERYRLSLERLAQNLGIKQHVIFYNRFVELEELTEFIGAADIYVTPYLNPAQITSGTLAYAFGCGKAVVSTPYWHAEELLADGRGVLVPFADSAAIARRSAGCWRRGAPRCDVRTGLPAGPRDDLGAQSAQHYMESFRQARADRQASPRPLGSPSDPGRAAARAARAGARPPGAADRLDRDLPARHLHHPQLRRGVLHRRQRPRAAADGPARAIAPRHAGAAAARDDLRGVPPGAFDRDSRRFRNFMGFDRRWLEEVGSEDCSGAACGRWAPASAGPSTAASRTGRPSSSSRPCRVLEHDLAPGLGVRPARHPGVPRALQRRPHVSRHARHADGPADSPVRRAKRRATGPGSRRSSATTTPGCRTP